MSRQKQSKAKGAAPPPAYLAPYCDAVDEHGATFEATLWNSREWQQRRFEAIATMIDCRGRRIVDCGCGLGDFAEFLTKRGVEYAAYAGLEGVPEIRAAAERRGLARARIALADFVADESAIGAAGEADMILFCGSLNTLDDAAVFGSLERAWAALCAAAHAKGPARSGAPALVFNFLSDLADERVVSFDHGGPARRLGTRRLFEWASERAPALAFRSDYLPGGHDATIAMWRAMK